MGKRADELGFDDDLVDEDPDFGLYEGTVYDNADPMKRYRVRVTVPGKVEPASDWARPFGTAWGAWGAPPKGAIVGLGFLAGDRRCPYYTGGPATPELLAACTPMEAGDPAVRVITDGRFTIQFDARAGKEGLRIIDHAQEQIIAMEAHSRVIRIKSVTAVLMQCMGNIAFSAVGVWFNKRRILDSHRGVK